MIDVTCVLGARAQQRLQTVVAVSVAVGANVICRLPHVGDAEDLTTVLDELLHEWRSAGARRVVVEAPELTRPSELLGAFDRLRDGSPGLLRLRGLITAVDAEHFRGDLDDGSYVAVDSPQSLGAEPLEARAQIVVDQVEFADILVVSAPDAAEGRRVASLLRALAPQAQLIPLRRGQVFELVEDRGVEHDAAGWMRLLTTPPTTGDESASADEVGAFVYSNVRPFHPGRLMALLDGDVGHGAFGTILRSAGFCRLSTRPERPAHWSHVGHVIAFGPLPADSTIAEGEELVAIGQEIAFIGFGLRRRSLSSALDDCTLTDEEFATGPDGWRAHTDPFPEWDFADDQSER